LAAHEVSNLPAQLGRGIAFRHQRREVHWRDGFPGMRPQPAQGCSRTEGIEDFLLRHAGPIAKINPPLALSKMKVMATNGLTGRGMSRELQKAVPEPGLSAIDHR